MPVSSLNFVMTAIFNKKSLITETCSPKTKSLCMVVRFYKALFNLRKKVSYTEIYVLVIYFYTIMK